MRIFFFLLGLSLVFRNVVSLRGLSRKGTHKPIEAKRMPVFNEEEEEELARIMNSVSTTKPRKLVEAVPTIQTTTPKPVLAQTNQKQVGKSTLLSVSRNSVPAAGAATKKKMPVVEEDGYIDFDYDDFEAALMEEERAGIYSDGGGGLIEKISATPEQHDGLSSGDLIPSDSWFSLHDSEGAKFDFSQLKSKRKADIGILFVDPRRMNEEFKIVLSEFGKVPQTNLQVSLAAINCDEPNDMKKFLKKASSSAGATTVLVDPLKKFVEVVKCRSNKRLLSALILLDLESCRILKIWYENTWDSLQTKDLIIDEIRDYRRSPQRYIQSQIGIR